jgi:hypothetical protein
MSAQLQVESWPDHIAATCWRYARNTTTPSRRPLLVEGDKMVFEYSSADRSAVKLVVFQGPNGESEAHGGPIRLTLVNPGAAVPEYRSECYGRVMTFLVDGGKLVYRAMYETDPHRHPDEGGEGDPW